MQMANGAKVKSGTFIGDGTASVTLNIGFEPDVVVINSNHYYNEAGLKGILFIVIVKGLVVSNGQHQTDSSVNIPLYGNPIASNEDIWGADRTGSNANYVSYAVYTDGALTVLNKTPNADQSKFTNEHEYTWFAIKK